MAENIADTTDKNESEINWEERAKKAEAKIVDMKKGEEKQEAPKEQEKEEEHYTKDALEEAVKKALKEQAIQNKEDEYKQNINETNSASIWGEESASTESFSPIEASEYLKLNTKERDDYREKCLAELWELTVL